MTILLGTPNIYLVDNKKAHRSSYLPMCFATCEISMKQTASHSNIPKFDQHKSQTSQILYQEPNLEEMHQKHNRAVEFLKNFSAVTLLLLSIFGLALVMLKGCADDVEHQQAMAVKHQIQFGGVK